MHPYGYLPSLRQVGNLWQIAIMNDAPSQSQDKFIIRLPDGMRERIKAYADENRRSMNAEIVVRITESLDAELAIAVIRLDFLASPTELYRAADRLENMAVMARERADHLLEIARADAE